MDFFLDRKAPRERTVLDATEIDQRFPRPAKTRIDRRPFEPPKPKPRDWLKKSKQVRLVSSSSSPIPTERTMTTAPLMLFGRRQATALLIAAAVGMPGFSFAAAADTARMHPTSTT
jgi:hypothetical protein